MRPRVWRLVFAVVLVLAVLLFALPMSVAAVPPVKTMYPDQGWEFDSSCGFRVSWEPFEEAWPWITFYDGQGNETKWIWPGNWKGRLTNLDNDKFVDVIVGPAQITPAGGSIYTVKAQSGWNDWGPDPPAGLPQFMLFTGQIIYKMDITGATPVEFIKIHGHVIDLCEVLQ